MKYLAFFFSLVLSSSLCSAQGQSFVTIYEENFENEEIGLLANGNVSTSLVTDPDTGLAQGTVIATDIANGGSQWGEINATPNQTIDLPAGAEPGTSEFKMSLWVYLPSETTFTTNATGADRLGLIIRWNALQNNNDSVFLDWESFTPNTWEEFTISGIIPALDNDGNSITRLRPIISVNDRGNDGAAGIAAYLDDFRIEIGISEDDPNFFHVSDISFGEVEQNGGPVTRTLPLTNSGTAQDLVISEINLRGADAAQFSLSEITLPLTLTPGESADLTLTVDPGEELGFLSANIGFVTNDFSTPNFTTNLTATSKEPFDGREFIVNGDFETGDLSGWRDNDRFDPTNDQARSGTTAAVYNLSAGNEWGEARFEQNQEIPDSIAITPEMIGKELRYSAWYYRPSTGGMAADDQVVTIFRWNAVNDGNTTFGRTDVGNIPVNQWYRVTGTTFIPETGGDGEVTTGVTILWSFRDTNADAAGGELMYLDDVSIKIDVPEPPAELAITSIVHDSVNDIVTLTYNTTPGVSYAIDRSTGLKPIGEREGWVELSDSETADEESTTFIDFGAPGNSDHFFYRVRIAD